MFAAAATVAQTVWMAFVEVAKWLAMKTLVVGLLAIVLPWVLRHFLLWAIDFFAEYADVIFGALEGGISSLLQTTGYDDFAIHINSVGGFLAHQTGLIDYCSIIFTGWGLYWTVGLGLRALRLPVVR